MSDVSRKNKTPNKFVVQKLGGKKEDNKQVVLSLRAPELLVKAFDGLANKTPYSRNKLICMAMQYALDNIDFII